MSSRELSDSIYIQLRSDGDSYLHYPHSSDPRDQQQQHIEGGKSVNSNSVDMNALRAENSLLKQQVEILQKNTKILRSVSGGGHGWYSTSFSARNLI